MMGSGKSTVGRLLASDARAFIDLDARVERLYGVSIAEMFATSEPHFRTRERRALETLTREPAFASSSAVVATGGGVVLDPANRELMRQTGTVVLLEVPVPVLVERLSAREQVAERPLLDTDSLAERLEGLARDRALAYRDGSIVVDADAEASVVATRVHAALQRHDLA